MVRTRRPALVLLGRGVWRCVVSISVSGGKFERSRIPICAYTTGSGCIRRNSFPGSRVVFLRINRPAAPVFSAPMAILRIDGRPYGRSFGSYSAPPHPFRHRRILWDCEARTTAPDAGRGCRNRRISRRLTGARVWRESRAAQASRAGTPRVSCDLGGRLIPIDVRSSAPAKTTPVGILRNSRWSFYSSKFC